MTITPPVLPSVTNNKHGSHVEVEQNVYLPRILPSKATRINAKQNGDASEKRSMIAEMIHQATK